MQVIDSALNVTLNISETLGSDNDTIFNTAIDIEGDIESGQSASHFTTKINTSIDGFMGISSVDETYYSYSDTVTSYSYSSIDNNWVKEELQTNIGVDEPFALTEMVADFISDIDFKRRKK